MKDYLITQNFMSYTPDQHAIWQLLYGRQQEVLQNRAFDFYLDCMKSLEIKHDLLPNFVDLNKILRAATGWEIIAVSGYIPPVDFFGFLAEKKFPSTTFIRRMDQLDYLQEPDIFHDVFGHVPLLMHPVFASYMHEFGKKGVEGIQGGYLDYITRLYWFTVEFGLIQTPKGLRIYGSGIVSSKGESIYCLESPEPHRLEFELLRVLRTEFIISEYQKIYFIIPSLDILYHVINQELTPFYEQAIALGSIPDYQLIESDRIMH